MNCQWEGLSSLSDDNYYQNVFSVDWLTTVTYLAAIAAAADAAAADDDDDDVRGPASRYLYVQHPGSITANVGSLVTM